MQEKQLYIIQKSVKNIAVGVALFTIIAAPLFIWFAVLLATGIFHNIETENVEQIIMTTVGFILFSCLALGSIYAFIPPLAEVEEFEISDGGIRIKRAALPPIECSSALNYRSYKILIPNYTEDKNRKNFEAYLYISWPVIFVVSERIDGYEEINKMLQGNAT